VPTKKAVLMSGLLYEGRPLEKLAVGGPYMSTPEALESLLVALGERLREKWVSAGEVEGEW
jgi:hypothetical protein